MNKITDEEIMNYIQELYDDFMENRWDQDVDLLGVFVYGKALYGFLDNLNDLKVVYCYIPNKEDIYFGENNSGLDSEDFTDVRQLLEKYESQDLRIMECVFSKYKIINPKYKILYDKEINMNKERLFHFNPGQRLKNAIDRAYAAIQYGNTFEALRIQMACNLYLQGVSIENCINIKEPIYLSVLQSCADGTYIPDQEQMIKEIDNIKNKNELIAFDNDTNAYYIVKNFIINIIKENLKEQTSEEDFYNSLTKSEKIAWQEIVMEINNYYGIISISKMVEKSEVSRPVFKSTLEKMEKYGMAEIVNMGVKGTQITMIK